MSPTKTDRLEHDPRVLEGLRAENQGTKQSRVFRIEARVERANLIRVRRQPSTA